MKVSVIICTYSEEMYEDFRECLSSVQSQTYDDIEIVLVVDGTESLYEQIYHEIDDAPNLNIYCNEENIGLLESRNKAAKLADGDVVAFIDDDAIADKRWIEELVAVYDDQDELAVGGKMTPEWVAGKPEFLPAEYYWLVGVTHQGFSDGPGYVRNTFGSNISFRRDIFLELDGFDSNIGGRKGDKNLQGGETELCARLADQYDRRVWYNPDAVVSHKVFNYRTDPLWLLDRAFWQGYSKRAMDVLLSDSDNAEENEYLRRLLFESLPARCRNLLTGPSVTKAKQFLFLWLFTGVVGLGYLYGFTKYRGDKL